MTEEQRRVFNKLPEPAQQALLRQLTKPPEPLGKCRVCSAVWWQFGDWVKCFKQGHVGEGH